MQTSSIVLKQEVTQIEGMLDALHNECLDKIEEVEQAPIQNPYLPKF
jgi:hypothetical protein